MHQGLIYLLQYKVSPSTPGLSNTMERSGEKGTSKTHHHTYTRCKDFVLRNQKVVVLTKPITLSEGVSDVEGVQRKVWNACAAG